MTKLAEGCMGKRGEGGMTKLGEGCMGKRGEGCTTKLGALSNDELLARLRDHIGRGNVWLAGLLAYLAEVDARRLYAERACSSMWDYCVRKLGMSESEAQRRIAVARLVRSFPVAGGYLERGEIHLCALYELHKHLNEDNYEELLREAVGKTTKAVAEILAARFPKPDVHACIEPLAPQPALPVEAMEMVAPSDVGLPATATATATATGTAPAQVRPRVEPLSASRYRVELTVSAETKAKLERVQELMRHRNPSGDLEKIVEASIDLLVTKLEKERLGKTTRCKGKRPSTTTVADGADGADGATISAAHHPAKPSRRAHVARAVQREVWTRDAEQCTYVDAEGNRCPARGFLELDHIDPKALGGSDEAANLRLVCRVHNRLHAEHVFGRAHIEERIHLRQGRSAAAPAERKHVMPIQAEPKHVKAAQASRPCAEVRAPSFETAARGLRSLGFRESEVREVIARLSSSLGPDTSVETIVRDALRLLT